MILSWKFNIWLRLKRQRMMLETRLMTQNDGQVVGFQKMYRLTVLNVVTTRVSNELNFFLCLLETQNKWTPSIRDVF